MSKESEKRIKSWIKVISGLLVAIGTFLAGLADIIQALE